MSDLQSTALRKIAQETRRKPEPGFPKMGPVHYLEWLKRYHETEKPELYFEVGTESGASLAFARSEAIAVDPEFRISSGVLGKQSALHLFQQTSDNFFDLGFLERYEKKINFAFLDGMHLVEFLLRDFINTEKHMDPAGCITMHDCVPMSPAAADRVWDKSKTRRWTGDVWKILPILRAYRPDLNISVLDLAPSGIVKIDNLNPDNHVLADAYEDIVREYVPLTLDDYGLEKFSNSLRLEQIGLVPAKPSALDRWEAPDVPAERSLKIALKTPKARMKNPGKIVDYPFARALADGLLEQGHSVRIDAGDNWYSDSDGTDFDLILRGRGGFVPQEGIQSVIWALYPGKKDRHQITKSEVEASDHCFFASEIAHKQFSDMGFQNISVLMQGCDHHQMHLPSTEERSGIIFVGSNHFEKNSIRPIVNLALEAGAAPKIWGRGWTTDQTKALRQARYLENSKVGDVYRAAMVVLCDHMEPMRVGGYLSNRIYDALACGAPVICDLVAGLPKQFGQDVFLCSSPKEFAETLRHLENENEQEQMARRDRLSGFRMLNSIAARTEEISKVLLGLAK